MNTLLNIRAVKKHYFRNGKLAKEALKGVTLDVYQGEILGLLGPNGAGKSTLIGIVAGLVNKTEGKVEIHGYNIDRELERAKSAVGLVPQEFNFNIFMDFFESFKSTS